MLEIKNLKTRFNTYDGVVKALEGVNLEVNEGEVFGIVGETGCGKSVTSYSLMQLLPRTAEIVAGEITLDGEEITGASDSRMRQIRGGEIGMIFQDPLSALNPVMKIKDQISEVIRLHQRQELEVRTTDVGSGNERNPYILWSLIFVSLVSLFYL